MTRTTFFSLWRTLAFLGPVVFCLPAGRISAQNQEVQVIEVTAKKYQYSPTPVHVKQGAKIQLKITAIDHDHGFKIAALPDGAAPGGAPGLVFASAQHCWELKKGETANTGYLYI